MSKKSKNKCDTHPYDNSTVPPCSAYLKNLDPIIKDGKIIFRNYNSIFYFISTNPAETIPSSLKGVPYISTNIQISLNTFLIGIYISQLQCNKIQYKKDHILHENKSVNKFLHDILTKNPKVNSDFSPSLTFTLSNGNAILSAYTNSINITTLNYYILFILTRLDEDPVLFFANNSFVTPDIINLYLASINLTFC
ncbi:hypothetical protein ACER0A_001745 [Haloimpatiens sp. FM7315]|uniref:hypothetical protein n=1 Tax=Haloimpatiens sp. FM7315 TaxID=3298609 RepID=UPI00370B7149